MENFKVILGRYFIANDFEVKVALKKGFENGHMKTFIEVNSEHLKTGLKSSYKIPFYSFVTNERFEREVSKAKEYFCSPVPKENSNMNLSGIFN